MKKLIAGMVLTLVLFALSPQAQAKWWIFGKAEDIPEITSLFIGNIDVTYFDADELMLDKSNIEGGMITIKGFAAKGEAPLATAQVSLDDGTTWEDVEIKGGTFIYQFTPEENKEYKPQFKVMDTAGKESDIRDLPQFVLIYREVDVRQIAEEVKNGIVAAYDSENLSRFMSYISDDFTGDIFALEEAVRSDFEMFDNMNTDVRIQQVTKSGDQINVDFDFDWTGVITATGGFDSESGSTSFIFVQEGGTYKVLSMACPIVFGSSEASQISTDFYGGLPIYTIYLADSYGVDFATGAIQFGSGDMVYNEVGSEFSDGSGAMIQELGRGTVSDYNKAPDSNWILIGIGIIDGYVYAVKRGDNTYAILEVVSGAGSSSVTIKYKYQPNGSTSLP